MLIVSSNREDVGGLEVAYNVKLGSLINRQNQVQILEKLEVESQNLWDQVVGFVAWLFGDSLLIAILTWKPLTAFSNVVAVLFTIRFASEIWAKIRSKAT